jgi:hypothetical protein
LTKNNYGKQFKKGKRLLRSNIVFNNIDSGSINLRYPTLELDFGYKMKMKQKFESCTIETPIFIDVADRDLVSHVVEEVLAKDLTDNETSKKLKEKKQFYITHI